jgi:tetratricopeptide (TPR) repeat protein
MMGVSAGQRVAFVVSAVLVCCVFLTSPADARGDKTVMGDVIKGIRFINSMRFDEAKIIVAELSQKSPDLAEVRWLRSTLAFNTGDYAGAVSALAGVPDDGADGEVASARNLAQSSLDVTKNFIEVKSRKGHFLIRFAPGADQAIAELAGDVLDLAHEQLGQDLGLAPTDPIRVELLGSPLDLAKLSPLTETEIETTGTIALSKYNKLMVVSPRATTFGYPWMDTLAHEYTHLIVSRISFDTVPVWLQEGIARFQQVRWRSGPGVAMSTMEQSLLSTALRKGRLITFDEMHPSMAKLPSQEAAALAYAEVYALVGWMHQKVGYQGLRDMLTQQRDGATTKHAVASVMGITWGQLELGWKNSLRTADASVKNIKPHKGRPIRFSKGGSDSENVGLDQVAKASRRFARLGGMLRAKGRFAAAAVEYEKALAIDPTDSFVAGKLARTLINLGNFDRAAEVAEPLLAKDSEDAVAAVTVGVARAAQKNFPAAIAAFELALRISPFDPATRCGLSTAYAAVADPRAAREQAACTALAH